MENYANRRSTDGYVDPDEDRYPTLEVVFSAILEHGGLPEGPLERVEATCLANGDITCRVWEPRALESQGLYLAADQQ